MNQAKQLMDIAQELATGDSDFFKIKGPGAGDIATNTFMANLRERARITFGHDYAEQKICGENGFRVDYYLPSEATIVEIALGLSKPKTEFERDILKAIMAREAGHAVEKLIFISKPGAQKKCSQPGRKAIVEWLQQNHGITIEVYELSEKATSCNS